MEVMETEKTARSAGPTLVFIHGLDSSSRGTKGAFFQARYPRMIVEDFEGPFEERMAKLEILLADKDGLTLIGSSLGGLMAVVFSFRHVEKIAKLILLAPALNHLPPEMCRDLKLDFPVVIYHGNHDEVVPPGPVHDIARQIFTNLTYHLVEDDHSLHEIFFSLAWDDLLSV
jgi:pimeloyl-ACP methyl ester carboxylesterase